MCRELLANDCTKHVLTILLNLNPLQKNSLFISTWITEQENIEAFTYRAMRVRGRFSEHGLSHSKKWEHQLLPFKIPVAPITYPLMQLACPDFSSFKIQSSTVHAPTTRAWMSMTKQLKQT